MSTVECNVDLQAVQSVLVESAQRANRYCHFSQRDRQMNAAQFAQLVVLGWLHHPQASLNELALHSQQLGFCMSAQGLDARLNERARERKLLIYRALLERLAGDVSQEELLLHAELKTSATFSP